MYKSVLSVLREVFTDISRLGAAAVPVEETTALFPFPWKNDSIMCCPLFARFVQQREKGNSEKEQNDE